MSALHPYMVLPRQERSYILMLTHTSDIFQSFIRPGARRLNAVSNSRDLQTTSFINTDGHIAVVILNTTGRMVPYTLYIEGKTMEMESPAHSIMTCIL